jgi:hypothetical protein
MSDALTPAQLDRIEDALEALERDGVDAVLAGGDPDPPVEDTLHAYYSLLQLSRDVLTASEVPAGLLDDVLAEARAVAAAPKETPAVVATPWWRRVRWSAWGPGLAFAATAAILLVVVRPANDTASESAMAGGDVVAQKSAPPAEAANAEADLEEAPAAAEADGRLADSARLATATPADGEGTDEERGAGIGDYRRDEKLAEREDDADTTVSRGALGGSKGAGASGGVSPSTHAPASGPGRAADDDAKPDPNEPTPTTSAGSTGTKVPVSPAPAPAPAKKSKAGGKASPPPPPAAEPEAPVAPKAEQKPSTNNKDVGGLPADDAWSWVTTGDARRKTGNCTGAKPAYESALEGDARSRARGFAGLGLCALAAGNDATAEGYFDKARKADASVGSFIQTERASIERADAPLNADEE